ncbi:MULTISPECIES: Flp family type IVb pilin [Pseudomonas]|uniref:Flp family type IVb pilin n=1 Tax=Pseudomonas nitroreducens TaxID=46680 RepID=UPI00147C3663|nr:MULTISPECIES: Flp family type IVb pilin [Pseudomonas]NNN25844.1 Flp family type IVb pilin [Pseudomonas nitroreducens]
MKIKTSAKQLSKNILSKAKSFLRDREGATAIEYAVIAGLISIALLTAAGPIGTRIGALMAAIRTAISA